MNTVDITSDTSTPHNYVTDWFNSNKIIGSGATWHSTGITTPAKSGLDADGYLYNGNGDQYETASPVNVKWYGAGDGDSKTAFQKWSIYLNKNKVAGYIPSGLYEITEGFVILSGVHIYSEGAEIKNTANSASFWKNTCIFFGTYFGGADEFYDETSYDVDDISAGDRTITLSNAGDGLNFSTGSVGLIQDPHLTIGATAKYNIHEHMNEVLSVSGDILTLKYPVKDDYTADSSPVQIFKETNTLSSTVIPSFYSGYKTELAKNSSVKNIKFSQEGYGQVFHAACYESLIENVTVEGGNGWGINPCSYTTFRNIKTYFRGTGFEMAYCHNDILIDGFEIHRIESRPSSLGTIIFSETGQDVRLTNFRSSGYSGGDAGIGIVGVSTRRTHISHGTISGSDGAGVVFVQDEKSNGGSASFVDIMNQDTQGIYIRSNDISATHNIIRNTPAPHDPIKIEAGVTRYYLSDNIV